MFGVVFLSLLVTTVVACCIVAAMFADVAFAHPAGFRSAIAANRRRGDGGAGSLDGAGLALRFEQTVSRVITKLGMKPAVVATCDAACHEREIQVTTPEVLAIVQELNDQKSPALVDSIRMQAQRNQLHQDGGYHCPLLMSGGFCACQTARPVSCRTRCVAGADSPVEAQLLADVVGTGVTEVFQDCLQASGLDDSRYELNYALAHVLETPQAARRWARGEQILKPATTASNA